MLRSVPLKNYQLLQIHPIIDKKLTSILTEDANITLKSEKKKKVKIIPTT